MKLDYLDWDSIFFSKRISRLLVESSDSKEEIFERLKEIEGQNDLIYIFSDEGVFFEETEKMKLVDRKVIYTGLITSDFDRNKNIKNYKKDYPNAELYKLSLISGEYSRYKFDSKFEEDFWRKLYYKWIENSTNKSYSDGVLCYYLNGKIKGMLSFKIENDTGKIGLIAVDSDSQKYGIGSHLINYIKSYLFARNINRLEVATQSRNIKACSFYEKHNLDIKSITNIYHYWVVI